MGITGFLTNGGIACSGGFEKLIIGRKTKMFLKAHKFSSAGFNTQRHYTLVLEGRVTQPMI